MMKPEVIVIYDGKKTVHKIDESAPLFMYIVKKLMTYTMSQDVDELPNIVVMILLVPKRSRSAVMKNICKKDFEIVYNISKEWSYAVVSNDWHKSGWKLNNKLLDGQSLTYNIDT